MNLAKILDWIGKNLSRIKTVGICVLIVLFAISVFSNGYSRKETENLIEKVTGLNISNDILKRENQALDYKLQNEVIRRLYLDSVKTVLTTDRDNLRDENKALKKKLSDIPQWVLNLPVDSSYKYLCETAYPFPGEKKYPFNEPQVKNIHADYLENVQLTGLVSNLELQLNNCGNLYSNADSLAKSYQKSFSLAYAKADNSDKRADNSEAKAVIYEKAGRKERLKKNIWRVVAGGEAVGLILLLLL